MSRPAGGLRVAMVSEHASPLAALGGVDAGGQNVHVAALAAALARRGASVVVHTRRDDANLPAVVSAATGFSVDHVDAGPPWPVPKDQLLPYMGALAEGLRQRWEQRRPDVVHAHFWMSGLASLWAARPLSIPVVITFHALGTVKRRHQGAADTSPPERVAAERRLVADADRVIATCADERRELVAMDADPRRVVVVPCGVDLELFAPDGPAEERASRPRLVAVSRLVPRKGLADAITAVSHVPHAELVVAGGPPAAALDGEPEALGLRELARSLGVADRVRLRGRVPHHRLPALLRSADLVVCSPWYEPFGMVALEAMACGVPVVATGVGGLADSVVDGETGLLVPPRQPAALATAIGDLLASPGRRAAMGASGAERARRLYSWEVIAAHTEAVYMEVAAGALAGGARP
ncbi:MAG TPA: glycosyltransferase [Acidimicrobiales bacterium]|nr:glycosyltransferase [Acidimicrobiales bacterium]